MPGTGPDPSGVPVPSEQTAQTGPREPETRGFGGIDPSDVVDELIDTAEKLVGDRLTALSAIKSEVERRIAHLTEWAIPGEEGLSRERADPATPGQGTGGAMPAHPDPVTRRPFTGYDRERATYARIRCELLARAEGQFVVIVGDDFEGPMDTFEAALRAGYRRFGLGPLYVKRVLKEEAVVEVSRDVVPCRS